MSYKFTVFVTDQSTITPELLAEGIKGWYANDPSVEVQLHPEDNNERRSDPTITVDYSVAEPDTDEQLPVGFEEKWQIRIWFMDRIDPDHQGAILEVAASHPHCSEMAACRQWIQVASDKDWDLNYFNDHLYIIHVFERFPGMYIFDEVSQESWPSKEE